MALFDNRENDRIQPPFIYNYLHGCVVMINKRISSDVYNTKIKIKKCILYTKGKRKKILLRIF